MTNSSGSENALSGLTADRIASFLAVADAGGIAKAAPGDPVRQSHLSRQLRELGQSLGFELMRRQGHGMTLTRGGARVVAVLRELVVGIGAARRAELATPEPVTLLAGDSVLRWLLVPRLPEILAEAPGTALSVRAVTAGFDRVAQGEADFAVSRYRRAPDGMRVTRLGRFGYGLFGPAPETSTAKGALAELPFVEVTGSPETLGCLTDGLPEPPHVVLRCETFPQAAVAVATGRYAAILPLAAAAELPPDRVVRIPFPPLASLDLTLGLVARRRRLEASPALQGLFDALTRGLRAGLAPA